MGLFSGLKNKINEKKRQKLVGEIDSMVNEAVEKKEQQRIQQEHEKSERLQLRYAILGTILTIIGLVIALLDLLFK